MQRYNLSCISTCVSQISRAISSALFINGSLSLSLSLLVNHVFEFSAYISLLCAFNFPFILFFSLSFSLKIFKLFFFLCILSKKTNFFLPPFFFICVRYFSGYDNLFLFNNNNDNNNNNNNLYFTVTHRIFFAVALSLCPLYFFSRLY